MYFVLIQAFAEGLHEKVRRELWGYSNAESLEVKDLHKINYEVRNNSSLFSAIYPFYLSFI